MKRLVRSREKVFSGVAGGIANSIGVSPVAIRFLFGVALCCSFARVPYANWFVLAYIILSFAMPEE